MRKYYFSLALVTGAALGAQVIIMPFFRASPMPLQNAANDAETQLALGQTINLWNADMYEVELIPRISDVLARRILISRDEMHAYASTLEEGEKHQALELVKGIGPKTAQRLSSYLNLNSPDSSPGSSQ